MLELNGEGAAQEEGFPTLLRSHLHTRVDRYDLAFPLDAIVSVHEAPLVSAVPSAQPGILGAIKVRGEPVVVFDIRRALRLAPKPVEPRDRLLLVRAGDRAVGIIVDQVLDLIQLSLSEISAPDGMFGDTPINRQVIAGLACGRELCAVVRVEGLALPDPWEEAPDGDLFATQLAPGDPLAVRTLALGAKPETDRGFRTDVAIFRLGGQRYAVPITSVVEFFSGAAHSPLPYASNMTVSLLNRRGEVLPLYDVKPLLGLPGSALSARVDGMVLAGASHKIAIAVEALDGLETLDAVAPGGTRPGRFCASVHSDAHGAVQLLDVAALCAAPQLKISE